MDNILGTAVSKREVFYQRQRTKNRFFAQLASFFADEAARHGITKREIAHRLSCDPAQITRWLSGPSNMTIEGISDILLSMGAEADLNIVKFADRAVPNYVHPLISAATTVLRSIPEISGAISSGNDAASSVSSATGTPATLQGTTFIAPGEPCGHVLNIVAVTGAQTSVESADGAYSWSLQLPQTLPALPRP